MNFLTSTRGIQEQESGSSSAKGMYPFSQSSSSSQQIPLPLSCHNPRSSNESKELMLMDSSNNHGDSEPADEVVDHGTRANTASASVMIEREHMFDKVVTPSDVGKLNRLVIPKQHAEKYFPLDSSSNDHKAGLLLNFEDRNGKPWRFRYSYWNSSQSYVMTKGWSRFVKEKKLDAGDIVSFQRGAGELGKHRLFIDWRRRPDAPDHMMNPYHLSNWNHHHHHRLFLQPFQTPSSTHSRLLLEGSSISQQHYSHYPHSYRYGIGNTSPYYDTCFSNTSTAAVVNANPCEGRSASQFVLPQQFEINMQMQRGSTVGVEPMVYNSVPVVQGKVAAKRLRLFGVNMDCPMISNLDDSDHDMFSSTTSLLSPTTTAVPYSHFSSSSTSTPNLLQSRNFNNYSPLQIVPPEELSDKGKASMSLDLDI